MFGTKLTPAIADKAFYISNVLIAFIMVVAIYVHHHPNMPAETVLLGMKLPYLTVFILLLAGFNIYLYRKKCV